ncbi:MAG TPA: TldD/PmbA family protein [Planctomycetes bacterium]|nr:TldD/PmbA family protein [Planctomycetota bacterium]HIL51693.1 TldD/PmbA family protein [Planctomycetota bacterium]
MPMQNSRDIGRLAERLIDASEADETEVSLGSGAERFVRFADSGPTQSADRNWQSVSIRARFQGDDGWREARADCDGSCEARALGALERATILARMAPPNPEARALGGAVDVREQVADEATASFPFEEMAPWVQMATAACTDAGLAPAGLIQCRSAEGRLVNSAGREVACSSSRAGFCLTASSPDFKTSAGFADAIHSRVGDLDAEAVVRRAVSKALAGAQPQNIEPGEYTVVLEPNAVSALLLFASYAGFGAQEVAEESSFLCGREGQQIFPESLQIADDAHNEFHPGCPYDGEGWPRQPVQLVDAGRVGTPVTDSKWAAKLGLPNTGHGLAMPNTSGPIPMNLVLSAGEQSLAELIGGVEHGLLITQFHYTNLIDPKDLLLTGMTRNGTFRIEKGEIGPAVKNLRFTESFVKAFGSITGIGSEREVAGALFEGEVICPALRIENFRFTSSTDF